MGQNCWLSLIHTRMSLISFHDSALKAILFVFNFPPHLQYDDEPQHRKTHSCVKKQGGLKGRSGTRFDMVRIFVEGLHFLPCLYHYSDKQKSHLMILPP